MKLAEALILRADCQKRIAQLKSRLLTNAKVQEGDAPAETPQDLIVEVERAASELLVSQIMPSKVTRAQGNVNVTTKC